MDSIKQLFSPPVIAAIRYFLAALGTLLAGAGFIALSPQQIDKVISLFQQLGTTLTALLTLVGLTAPVVSLIYGMLSATIRQQIGRVKDIAQDKSQPLAEDAKQALIAATIAQPSVQTIVTDRQTAADALSESVVAADTVIIKRA